MPDFIANNPILSIFIVFLAVISVFSVIMCVYDKIISKRGRVELRVSEKALLVLSALGGSVAMLLTMLIVRHKTKHIKFMLGIPLIIVAQAVIVFLLFYFKVF